MDIVLEGSSLDDLSPPYVLLEDRLDTAAAGLLYVRPRAIIRCDDARDVEAAFQQVERGLASSLHAAGLFLNELGYALEPRLAPLMPISLTAPLLWLGLFDAPIRLDGVALNRMFAQLGPRRLCGWLPSSTARGMWRVYKRLAG